MKGLNRRRDLNQLISLFFMSVHTSARLYCYFAHMNELPRKLSNWIWLFVFGCFLSAHCSAQLAVRGKRYRHSLELQNQTHDSLIQSIGREQVLQSEIDVLKADNARLNLKLSENDRFFQEYGCVNLSERIWMLKSIRDSIYHDGTIMKEAKSTADWVAFFQAGEPCFAKIPVSANREYGFLYNIHAVNAFNRWAPAFLEIPNSEVIAELFKHLETCYSYIEINQRASLLKSADGWPITPGNNKSGLTIMKGGFCSGESLFTDVKTNFWMLPENDSNTIQALSFSDYDDKVGVFSRNKADNYGFFIRCILKTQKNGK